MIKVFEQGVMYVYPITYQMYCSEMVHRKAKYLRKGAEGHSMDKGYKRGLHSN